MNSDITANTQSRSRSTGPAYVLMTAAYNEEAFIGNTIASLLEQTVLPRKWVIVSDGSTDGTDAIVSAYASRHSFIEFVRVQRETRGHSLSAKVRALRNADRILRDIPYDYIGKLDADITIQRNYFSDLINALDRVSRLGLVSGFVFEKRVGSFQSRKTNRTCSIPHAAQLMRRECYEAMGGYVELKYGGEDWYAHVAVKMAGWDVEAFPNLPVFHHKPTGAGTNGLKNTLRLGKLDYAFGSHPAFELVKCLLRVKEQPILLGAAMRLWAFSLCHIRGEERAVPQEVADFVRKEQMERFSSFLHSVYQFGWKIPYSHRS